MDKSKIKYTYIHIQKGNNLNANLGFMPQTWPRAKD